MQNELIVAKQALDTLIAKSRVHLYKPIQIAEILYHSRTAQELGIILDDLETYRCACLKDDLEPCGMMSSTCEAGYLQKDPDPEYDFVIGAHKPEEK